MFIKYLFIGVIVSFLIDLALINLQNHPKVKPLLEDWQNEQRIACITLWPLALLMFLISFIKQFFKK